MKRNIVSSPRAEEGAVVRELSFSMMICAQAGRKRPGLTLCMPTDRAKPSTRVRRGSLPYSAASCTPNRITLSLWAPTANL